MFSIPDAKENINTERPGRTQVAARLAEGASADARDKRDTDPTERAIQEDRQTGGAE